MVLLPRPRQARLDHGAVPPFRKKKKALPSFFEHVHMDTPRKCFSQKTSGSALGRPCSLEPAPVLVLADLVSRVCSRVCCGAGVLAELLNAHLGTLGVQYRFSARQSRKFMRSLWYSLKKPKGELGKVWPAATTRTPRELYQQKIEWTLTDRSRIINIDETCCKMLPLLERRWLAGGEQHDVVDTRRNITVSLATRHLVPDVCAQLTFQGKTSAVEPANACPSLLTTSHSESHWTTTTSSPCEPWCSHHHCCTAALLSRTLGYHSDFISQDTLGFHSDSLSEKHTNCWLLSCP